MVRKNDTTYVAILLIEALGIAIDFITLISNHKTNIVLKLIIYLMAIILPLIIVVLEKRNIEIMANLKLLLVDTYILLGNNKRLRW